MNHAPTNTEAVVGAQFIAPNCEGAHGVRPPPKNLAAQFPKGSWFEVYDCGVGDEVARPKTLSVSLVRAGVYRLITTGEVAVTVPNNAQIEYATL